MMYAHIYTVSISVLLFFTTYSYFTPLSTLVQNQQATVTEVFQALIQDPKKVTIAYFAPNSCTYCLLKDLYQNRATLSFMRFYSYRVHFILINTMQYPELAIQYHTTLKPVMAYYMHGKEVYKSYSSPTLAHIRHTLRRYCGI